MNTLPTVEDLRRMSDRELRAYAETAGTDDAAWDELAERNADRAAGWCERPRELMPQEAYGICLFDEV